MILIDATGVLSSFGSPPTGIPRIETFLVTAALADPDRAMKVVRYDRRQNAFRELRHPNGSRSSAIPISPICSPARLG